MSGKPIEESFNGLVASCAKLESELATVKAERDRYKKALGHIARHTGEPCLVCVHGMKGETLPCVIAKEALAGEVEK